MWAPHSSTSHSQVTCRLAVSASWLMGQQDWVPPQGPGALRGSSGSWGELCNVPPCAHVPPGHDWYPASRLLPQPFSCCGCLLNTSSRMSTGEANSACPNCRHAPASRAAPLPAVLTWPRHAPSAALHSPFLGPRVQSIRHCCFFPFLIVLTVAALHAGLPGLPAAWPGETLTRLWPELSHTWPESALSAQLHPLGTQSLTPYGPWGRISLHSLCRRLGVLTCKLGHDTEPRLRA